MDGRIVLTAHPSGTDGVQLSTTDYRPAAADSGSTDDAVSAPTVRLYRVGAVNPASDGRTGLSQEETCGTRNGREPSTRTGGHDAGRTVIWRKSPQFEDADSECLNTGGQSGTCSSPSSRR
jgi:hypothetical protein